MHIDSLAGAFIVRLLPDTEQIALLGTLASW
jgi:hypothetical protein